MYILCFRVMQKALQLSFFFGFADIAKNFAFDLAFGFAYNAKSFAIAFLFCVCV